ncbi:MAG: CBS domain-containing protein [Candidatus Diapherotrites archaeon]|nr:CBS domain-containing protein [Candidatus Diapherotrites archaeon]
MQLPELTEIKRRRKELELSQTELAKMANISQPLLAKIESNQVQPAYDKAKRIFLALESIQTSQGLTAKQIMSKHIFAVSPKDPVKKAIQLMEKQAVSQIPVLGNGKSVGLISEKAILSAINSGKIIDLGKSKIDELMEEGLPVIAEETPLHLIYGLLEHQQAVLIATKGKISGIITKSDLLKTVL